MASDERQLREWRAHPNFSRIRAWLDAHGWFNAQLKDMCTVVENLRTASSAKVCAECVEKLRSLLDTLELRLDAHSTFEDKNLFPMLERAFPWELSGVQSRFDAQHRALDDNLERLGEHVAALDCHSGQRPEPDRFTHSVLEAMRLVLELQKSMHEHFVDEEERCVHLWLSLPPRESDEGSSGAGSRKAGGLRAKL